MGMHSLWGEQEALAEFQSKFIFMCLTDEAFPSRTGPRAEEPVANSRRDQQPESPAPPRGSFH